MTRGAGLWRTAKERFLAQEVFQHMGFNGTTV
jgi:hypothetical protein